MLKVFIKFTLAAAVVAAFTFQARSAHAAVNAYLAFTDNQSKAVICPGDSLSTSHPKTIELTDFSFGFTQTLNIGSQSSGAGAGKVTFSTFAFAKKLDSATTCIATALMTGKMVNATLFLSKAAGGSTSMQDFLTVTFKMAAFKSQNFAHDDASGASEKDEFEFGAEQIKFVPQRADGTAAPALTTAWNRVTNTDSLRQ